MKRLSNRRSSLATEPTDSVPIVVRSALPWILSQHPRLVLHLRAELVRLHADWMRHEVQLLQRASLRIKLTSARACLLRPSRIVRSTVRMSRAGACHPNRAANLCDRCDGSGCLVAESPLEITGIDSWEDTEGNGCEQFPLFSLLLPNLSRIPGVHLHLFLHIHLLNIGRRLALLASRREYRLQRPLPHDDAGIRRSDDLHLALRRAAAVLIWLLARAKTANTDLSS